MENMNAEVLNDKHDVRESKFILATEDLEESLLKYEESEATDNDGSDKRDI